MVRDFGNVKAVLTEQVHDVFDHGFIVHELDTDMKKGLGLYFDPEPMQYISTLNWKVIVVPYYPTAECLAKDIFERCRKYLPNLYQIDVWETPTSCASYNIADESR